MWSKWRTRAVPCSHGSCCRQRSSSALRSSWRRMLIRRASAFSVSPLSLAGGVRPPPTALAAGPKGALLTVTPCCPHQRLGDAARRQCTLPRAQPGHPDPKRFNLRQDCLCAQKLPRQRRAVCTLEAPTYHTIPATLNLQALGGFVIASRTPLPLCTPLLYTSLTETSRQRRRSYSRRRSRASAPSMPTPRTRGCSC
eukprot:2492205-Prymnesium_polylepis.1